MKTFTYEYPVKVCFGDGIAKTALAAELAKYGKKCAAGLRRRLGQKGRYL